MSSTKFSGTLRDGWTDDKTKVPFTVEHSNGGTLWFHANGYGNEDAPPVKIEWYEGQLWVLVWADINNDDPTHKISLSGTMKSAIREDK
jgi:hypothetical protein